MALLRLLLDVAPRLNLRVVAAHLDHGIRGAASAADARFVARAARRLGVRCILGRARVPLRAKARRISLEMAAREARYAFLARAARRVGADAVATAHTADDQAETVLLKLARGAGPQGLSGIPYEGVAHGIRIVRPMLDVTRAQVVAFLRARDQEWREDESNRDPAHLRNRVRACVLPVLERELNPDVRSALRRTADILSAENEWMDAAAREALAGASRGRVRRAVSDLSVAPLAAMPVALRRRALRLWLSDAGVPADTIDYGVIGRVERLLRRASGTVDVELTDGWAVRRAYASVAVCPPGRAAGGLAFRAAVRVPGETAVAGLFHARVWVEPGIVRERGTRPGRLPARASISRDKVGRRRLYLRNWQPGDRMRPFGMAGSKKLQDILVDAKVPRPERIGVPVVECGGEIIWMPGYRIAEGWGVRDGSVPALQIEIRAGPQRRLRGRRAS